MPCCLSLRSGVTLKYIDFSLLNQILHYTLQAVVQPHPLGRMEQRAACVSHPSSGH
uniref:Uncharacterized protein n=1 Tax=Anguilla anguilla TaxID=7936 RepID=A0A0E9Q7C4_ANGAN